MILSTTIVVLSLVVMLIIDLIIDFGSTFGFGCQSPSGVSCCPPRVGSVVRADFKKKREKTTESTQSK